MIRTVYNTRRFTIYKALERMSGYSKKTKTNRKLQNFTCLRNSSVNIGLNKKNSKIHWLETQHCVCVVKFESPITNYNGHYRDLAMTIHKRGLNGILMTEFVKGETFKGRNCFYTDKSHFAFLAPHRRLLNTKWSR